MNIALLTLFQFLSGASDIVVAKWVTQSPDTTSYATQSPDTTSYATQAPDTTTWTKQAEDT